jgi:hypothetical protein
MVEGAILVFGDVAKNGFLASVVTACSLADWQTPIKKT